MDGIQISGSSIGLWRRLCGQGRRREWTDRHAGEDSSDNRRLAAAADVRASVHDDGLVLLHISTGKVFLCNQTGLRIWQGLVEGLSADAISKEISREWGIGWERVRRHTSSFISLLERRGLVTPRADSSC